MAFTFTEALDMMVQVYIIDGVRAAYIDIRLDRRTVPEDVHVYEVRDTSDDGGWYIGNVEDSVFVNHAGTMFTVRLLRMLHPEWDVYVDMAEDDEPWESTDDQMTLRCFLEKEQEEMTE